MLGGRLCGVAAQMAGVGGSSEGLVGWRWCRPDTSSAGPGSPALNLHSRLLGNLSRPTVAQGSARLY